MANNKKILFPIDFSEGTRSIIPHVKEMADKFQSEIHILYVVHVTPYYEGVGIEMTYVADFEDTVVKQAKIRMEKFIDQYFKNYAVIGKVMTGAPGETIIEYSNMQNMDLIIMGHSKKGIQRMILGSVAGYVVKYSHIPVMIVNPKETAASA